MSVLLSYFFFKMKRQIKIHHSERYEIMKWQLWFFYIVEIMTFSSIIVIQSMHLIGHIRDNESDDFDINILWIFYPLVQAFGMLRIKDSSDPLQGVSSLQNIIVSKNQKTLPSFKEALVKDGEYLKLCESQ
jgi:hypothetical protein